MDATSATVQAIEDCNDTAVARKIQDSLIPRVVLGMTEELYKELMADTPLQGLQSYGLDTVFNEHCLLCVNATGEWDAAYVQGFSVYRCFDKRSGNRLSIKDLIVRDSLPSLVRQLRETVEATILARREEIIADAETVNDTSTYDSYTGTPGKDITVESLENFYINKDGITFFHEFLFGHAFWNLAPGNAELSLPIDGLQPYIRQDGPLSFWVK